MRFPAVIFDLDGTLIDSLRDLAEATNWGLKQLGLPTHPVEAYRYMVGMGRHELCRRAAGNENEERVDRLSTLMTRHYSEHCLDHSRPYEGIVDMLKELQGVGLKMGILSNKPQNFVDLTVRTLLGQFVFDAVIGDRDGLERKPDPQGALLIAETFGLPPASVAYVGDTSIDMDTANRAGMVALGVTWGFRTRAELEEANAHQIAETPDELYRILAGTKS